MNAMRIVCTAIVLSMFTQVVLAETVYIKDKWYIRAYTQSNTASESVGVFPSGQSFEFVGKENNMTQVKLPSGELAWIKSSQLVKTVPSIVLVRTSDRTIKRLNEKIDALKADLKKAQALASKSTNQPPITPTVSSESLMPRPNTPSVSMEATASQSISRADSNGMSFKRMWWRILGSAILFVLVGFIFGHQYAKKKIQSRFNGAKIL